MFNIVGILKVKGQDQQVSEKFRKRDFVITDNSSQYAQHISFQLSQDRCDMLDPYQVGQEINVFFNLRGREWKSPKDGETKYFNSLEAWKIQPTGAMAAAAPTTTQSQPQQQDMASDSFTDAGTNDLPF